jgi:hypothetical protein
MGAGLTAKKMAECRWVRPELVGQFELTGWTPERRPMSVRVILAHPAGVVAPSAFRIRSDHPPIYLSDRPLSTAESTGHSPSQVAAGKQSFDVYVRELYPPHWPDAGGARVRLSSSSPTCPRRLRGKGGPSTIAHEPLQAIARGAFDSDQSVQGETSTMMEAAAELFPESNGSGVWCLAAWLGLVPKQQFQDRLSSTRDRESQPAHAQNFGQSFGPVRPPQLRHNYEIPTSQVSMWLASRAQDAAEESDIARNQRRMLSFIRPQAQTHEIPPCI